jgi:hypothetical protein
MYYASSNFHVLIKNSFGRLGVLHTVLAARSIGVMQQAPLVACIFITTIEACDYLNFPKD